MCGIIGYCGNNQAEPILLQGLHKLEYRGYDSVGIACQDEKNTDDFFLICKEVGKVDDLDRLCKKNPVLGSTGIGHCRWATHGGVTWNNAHPHISSDKNVVLVHNGIIENYLELKEFLVSKGYSFYSQSDTETVVNLLSYLVYTQDSVELLGNESHTRQERAMLTLKKWLHGSYALTVMFRDSPQEIFAIRHESPLVVGVGEDELLVASDIIPLSGYVNQVLYLNNNELAHLSNKDNTLLSYFGEDGNHKEIRTQRFDWNFETIDKQGFDYFMLKEIHEQPHIFTKLYSKYVDAKSMPSQFNFTQEQLEILQDINRIIFVSCGTSYHSSIYASYLFEKYTKIQSVVEYASEFRYREPILDEHTLVIALSQSGETADTLAALHLAKEQQAKTLGIVNVDTSSIARTVDIMLCTDCGPEIGVASTKAYTAQMLLMYYLFLYVGNIRNIIADETVIEFTEQTKILPLLAEKVLSQQENIKGLGRAYAGYQHMLYLGRGLFYPLALEGALKLKEISYIHAEGYAAAEMKHGPIALIDQTMPIVVCAPKHELLYEKIQSNIAEVKARGGRILALISQGDTNTYVYDDYLEVPHISETLDPILFSLPLQLLAYYAALAKGFDPDQPRNLAKSVTVE